MNAAQVRTRMLAQFGIRIEPGMSRYVLRQLADPTVGVFPVMGGDARTGVSVRRFLPAAAFNDSPPSLTDPTP